MYDVAIIGAGPAGLAAAATFATEGFDTLLLEGSPQVGGQISHSYWVENMIPFAHGFSGAHFREEALQQCTRLGVTIRVGYPVALLTKLDNSAFEINQHYYARTVVIATGVKSKGIPFPVQDSCGCTVRSTPELYPVTPDSHVIVVGGGNSAGQAALYYATQTDFVTLVSRRSLTYTMSNYLIKKLALESIDAVVAYIRGLESRGMVFTNGVYLPADVVHLFIHRGPDTSWLSRLVDRDPDGYIRADPYHRTRTPGLFAVGDCVSGTTKRVACALGAATDVVPVVMRYLEV